MKNPKQIVHVEPDQFSFISQAKKPKDLHATLERRGIYKVIERTKDIFGLTKSPRLSAN